MAAPLAKKEERCVVTTESRRQFQRLIARTWNECKNAEVWHKGIVKERLFVRRDNRVFILNKDAGLIRVLLDKILRYVTKSIIAYCADPPKTVSQKFLDVLNSSYVYLRQVRWFYAELPPDCLSHDANEGFRWLIHTQEMEL